MPHDTPPSSPHDSLIEANRSQARFSGHGKAKGAGGFKVMADHPDCEFLSRSGQSSIINPREDGFGLIRVGAAWDNVGLQDTNLIGRLFKKMTRQGVDIDLGCLYEMQDGTRGCVQAFGSMMGAFGDTPYIALSDDERTGNADGDDEFIKINGRQWGAIKRVLLYVYIYHGAASWAAIRPQIQLSVPGEHPMIVTPDAHDSSLAVCAVAMIENVRNGIRLTNHTEYFAGHAEMDRAFGFGIQWADGHKP